MIEEIINFFYSDTFLLAYYIFFFLDGFIMVIASFLIGQSKYIKKMDEIFYGYSPDYGIWLNSHRAFSYGMSMLFPNTLAKRVHKNVDLSKISTKDKLPYMLFSLSMLLLLPYLIVAIFI